MSAPQSSSQDPSPEAGSATEVLVAFLRLGLTSFGGPIAHLAYFRRELVERRRWLGDDQYAQLLALCQLLPGPASSQLGFGLGLLRAGWAGAMAAFVAFTLPSAMLMFTFAMLLPHLSGMVGGAAVHGLKVVALAVVAHGVLGMTRSLCPDAARASIAALAAALVLVWGYAWMQLVVVALGAVAGLALGNRVQPGTGAELSVHYSRRMGVLALTLFAVLLVAALLVGGGGEGFSTMAAAFYRAGALVFGGGHVVLPLLEESVVASGWVSQDDFLAGYGAAQAVPGPMFTLSAFLGARSGAAGGGLLGALIALIAIFLPGFLLLAGVLPQWRSVARRPKAVAAIAGINAAVVGLLGAALYDPVWTNAVRGPLDVAVALIGFTLLAAWRAPALLVVAWCVGATVAMAGLGLA